MIEIWKEINGHERGKAAIDALKTIDEIHIDTSMEIEQRMQKFLGEVENPYCFLCGNTPVRICFEDKEIELRKRLLNYFIGLK